MFCFQLCFEHNSNLQQSFPEGQWSTGLFDCCDDPSICLTTAFCPWVTTGKIVEIVDQGVTSRGQGCLLAYAMSVIYCGWQYGSLYRSKLRKQYSLPESPCSDVLIHCFCCACGTCQEYRELKNRSVHHSRSAGINRIRRNEATASPQTYTRPTRSNEVTASQQILTPPIRPNETIASGKIFTPPIRPNKATTPRQVFTPPNRRNEASGSQQMDIAPSRIRFQDYGDVGEWIAKGVKEAPIVVPTMAR